MCCLKIDNFAWIEPPTSCVVDIVVTTQPVNFCKKHNIPKLVYIQTFYGWKQKNNPQIPSAIICCLVSEFHWNLVILGKFWFFYIDTAEQQSLDIRTKRFWLRHPQVVVFVYLFHALFELTYSLPPFKQAITGVPTRPRGLLLRLPPTPTSEQPGGIWTLTTCKGETAAAPSAMQFWRNE